MNVAGALARGLSQGVPINVDSVTRLLSEAASTLPAPVAAGEGDVGEPSFSDVTGGASVEEVADRLTEPRFAELAQTVALDTFIFNGSAGIPELTKDEVEGFLTDVADRDPGFVNSWLELVPVDAAESTWVAYPQNVSTSVEFLLFLPVAVESGSTRLVTLDPGLDVMTETTRAPRVVKGAGCEPGITGTGKTLREVCLSAGCAVPCAPNWKVRRNRSRLTGCDC